jgi:hypothetical protein
VNAGYAGGTALSAPRTPAIVRWRRSRTRRINSGAGCPPKGEQEAAEVPQGHRASPIAGFRAPRLARSRICRSQVPMRAYWK